MNTKITITYKGEQYTLEYDRSIVRMLEKAGLNIDEFMEKPMTNIELAFSGAFIKNHKKVSQNVIDDIFASCKNKADLVVKLREMIRETYDSLLEDGKDDEGNVSWEVVDLSPKKSQK